MNPFSILALPAKANLEEGVIRNQFQILSKQSRANSSVASKEATSRDRLAELSEAYQVVLSPAKRLQSLLAIHYGDNFELKGAIPEALVDLFSQVGGATQEADAFATQKSKATTALAEAVLAPKLLIIQQVLGDTMAAVNEELNFATGRLDEVDCLISANLTEALEPSAALCRQLIYLEKWQQQIQARFHALI